MCCKGGYFPDGAIVGADNHALSSAAKSLLEIVALISFCHSSGLGESVRDSATMC